MLTDTMHKHILIVEDEPAIRDMLAFALRKGDFVPMLAADGRQAQERIAERVPDLILLDWMLPVGGLEAGVDDYVVKPFSARELLARIRAVLRRSREDDADGSVQMGALRIDGSAHRVFAEVDGTAQPIALGPTEYRLLHFFMTHPDRVYTRTQLLDHVWGGSVYVEERTVDVHIRRLRKQLEPHALDAMVQTVRGAGYRFSTAL